MISNNLDKLAKRVRRANANWWINIETGEKLERNIGELLMLTVSELAEAMEGHRKNLKDDKLPHHKMFDVEIVDTMIRLLEIAGEYIPGFGGIFEEKMHYNAYRADHQIKNRLKKDGKKY